MRHRSLVRARGPSGSERLAARSALARLRREDGTMIQIGPHSLDSGHRAATAGSVDAARPGRPGEHRRSRRIRVAGDRRVRTAPSHRPVDPPARGPRVGRRPGGADVGLAPYPIRAGSRPIRRVAQPPRRTGLLHGDPPGPAAPDRGPRRHDRAVGRRGRGRLNRRPGPAGARLRSPLGRASRGPRRPPLSRAGRRRGRDRARRAASGPTSRASIAPTCRSVRRSRPTSESQRSSRSPSHDRAARPRPDAGRLVRRRGGSRAAVRAARPHHRDDPGPAAATVARGRHREPPRRPSGRWRARRRGEPAACPGHRAGGAARPDPGWWRARGRRRLVAPPTLPTRHRTSTSSFPHPISPSRCRRRCSSRSRTVARS